ncbi:hypothetical protein GOBAR_AA39801 [Gossypium barbadense]|uniref:Uncharacterized protein n=1 Tax=Gossypium barbadense TaxID=3634 RepID=A0A2P5VQ04_GOSBA|nr:hypothetical protein GOBAR_DD18683 [Gossypium barbadense]PPR80921.1 hypothetical protein GOBAR_AA39801 [Gossypium barbadense]
MISTSDLQRRCPSVSHSPLRLPLPQFCAYHRRVVPLQPITIASSVFLLLPLSPAFTTIVAFSAPAFSRHRPPSLPGIYAPYLKIFVLLS